MSKRAAGGYLPLLRPRLVHGGECCTRGAPPNPPRDPREVRPRSHLHSHSPACSAAGRRRSSTWLLRFDSRRAFIRICSPSSLRQGAARAVTCGTARVSVGRARGDFSSERSERRRRRSISRRRKLGSKSDTFAPGPAARGASSQTLKSTPKNPTSTDPTRVPAAPARFLTVCGLRNCTGIDPTASSRAPRTVEHAQAAWRAAAERRSRPAAAAKSRFWRFGRDIAFGARRGRRVCTAVCPFDVGPCPTHPRASVGRVAGCGGPRGAAGRAHKTMRFHDPCRKLRGYVTRPYFDKNAR